MKTISFLIAILFAAGLTSSSAQDTWTQKADFGGPGRSGGIGFSIGSKGYMGTGHSNDYKKDFWEYDPAIDAWTQKSDFGGGPIFRAVGFSIGSKGYVGIGGTKDFWEYDPVINNWTKKADFGGAARKYGVGFSIGEKGYAGTGNLDFITFKDFWEYDPASDTWTQKSDFGYETSNSVGFSIGGKGYIGLGTSAAGGFSNDFWEYDPGTDVWTQKASFGGTERWMAAGFSIGSKGYIGTGYDYNFTNDFWEYDPAANAWSQKADFAGTARYRASVFSIGSKGYLGTGYDYTGTNKNDFWEYTPDTSSCPVPSNLSVTNITSSSAKLKWSAVPGAVGYGIRYKVAGISGWTYRTNYDNSKFIGALSPNTEYKWQVRTYCDTLRPAVTSVWSPKQHFTTGSLRIGDESVQQTSFQIYPNPAEDLTTIQFTLPHPSHVYIKVYDVSGKEIETLLDGELQQGTHSLQINTNQFPKGVYLVKMISPAVQRDGIENQKLIVQ